jgi:hypothetical protein
MKNEGKREIIKSRQKDVRTENKRKERKGKIICQMITWIHVHGIT